MTHATLVRQLKDRFGDEKARRIAAHACAIAATLGASAMNEFERHDTLAGFAALFGAQLFDASESIALNTPNGIQERGQYNDLTNLDEVLEIVRLTNAADPAPPARPSLMELMSGLGYPVDPINEEAEQMAEDAGVTLAKEGRA